MNACRVSAGKSLRTITMFGVTTACITQIRHLIEDDCECFVFHATGTGGQCLEKLIDSRLGELRTQLRRAETRVDEFRKANKILTSEGGLVTDQAEVDRRADGGHRRAELGQHGAGLAHHVPIRLRAHDDADERLSHWVLFVINLEF